MLLCFIVTLFYCFMEGDPLKNMLLVIYFSFLFCLFSPGRTQFFLVICTKQYEIKRNSRLSFILSFLSLLSLLVDPISQISKLHKKCFLFVLLVTRSGKIFELCYIGKRYYLKHLKIISPVLSFRWLMYYVRVFHYWIDRRAMLLNIRVEFA